MLASYTWSKFLDNASADGDGAANPFNLFAEKSVSDLDLPHRFVASFVYDLPKLGQTNALMRHVFGGWRTTGIILLQSGSPFSVVSERDNSQSSVLADRADLIGDPRITSDRNRGELIIRYFNTGAFAQNLAGTFGTAGRNILRGPGFANVDFGLFKDFPGFWESHRLQFRSEIFNLFNRPNFANPVNNLSAVNFGQINNTVGDPRLIQFALKYLF